MSQLHQKKSPSPETPHRSENGQGALQLVQLVPHWCPTSESLSWFITCCCSNNSGRNVMVEIHGFLSGFFALPCWSNYPYEPIIWNIPSTILFLFLHLIYKDISWTFQLHPSTWTWSWYSWVSKKRTGSVWETLGMAIEILSFFLNSCLKNCVYSWFWLNFPNVDPV
jgi:hypothetical protein